MRHAFYETFKVLHIALAILAVVGTWYHLQLKDLPQVKYLVAAVVLWGIDQSWRVSRVVHGNLGNGGTKAIIKTLPGNACSVTVFMARPWTIHPGQHAYIYMPTISFLQSHPFSIAWSDNDDGDRNISKHAATGQQATMRGRKISFIIRARRGFTSSLYRRAAAFSDGTLDTTCIVEGPYGRLHDIRSYGTVLLFAGGVGITSQLLHVRDLLVGYKRTVATKKIILIWAIPFPEHLEWVRAWMEEILAMRVSPSVLRIMLFVSRQQNNDFHANSETFQIYSGRPNIEKLVRMIMEEQIGALCVSVCGPSSLSDDVRRAVRNNQYNRMIDLIEESFS